MESIWSEPDRSFSETPLKAEKPSVAANLLKTSSVTYSDIYIAIGRKKSCVAVAYTITLFW